MKILIISFYYQPDLCAGSFRATAFVKALKEILSKSDSVTIVTTMPNRYSTYRADAKEVEEHDNVIIRRIRLPFHKSGFVDQSRAFFVYATHVLKHLRKDDYDAVFATSSRLFTAFLGAIVARRKKVPLYLDIRDIFTDTMLSVLKKSKLRSLVPLFALIEKYTVSSATNINLVSGGFASYFRSRYSKDIRYSFYSNGIDDEFLNFSFGEAKNNELSPKKIFTCTGNIGEGQGLEKIIPKIAERYPGIHFQIIGDGGRKRILREVTSHMSNVKLLDPVQRKDLVSYYEESDFLFLQLNDYDAFKKVLPSKIFEYAATYKPIIAGVEGYAKEFLQEHVPDSLIFKPCDIDDFCRKYDNFDGGIDITSRRNFINRFSREAIMHAMAQDFLGTLGR